MDIGCAVVEAFGTCRTFRDGRVVNIDQGNWKIKEKHLKISDVVER